MEPPAKRQRLGLGPAAPEDEDELDFDPDELNQRRDPAYQLEQARDHAVYKLKSRFENIFAKYEKDFTGVGDEIDLRTGQVVVDNGHLESMRSVKDGEEDDQDSEQEEERIMHGARATGSTTSDAIMRRDAWAVENAYPNRSPLSPMMGGPPRLSSMMFPSHNSFMTPPRSFDSFSSGASLSVDPAWQAPDLPRPAFFGNSFGGSGRQYGFGMGASTRKVTRKSLPAPRDQDKEDEDVLLGVSGNVQVGREPAKESPLIKRKFLTVDSSPNNDSGLKQLIQEVIENIPETPPSVQKPVASRAAAIAQPSGPGETSPSFQERDLESYQDVTGMPAVGLDRHAFYVEIQARNVNGIDAQNRPGAGTTNMKSIGPEKQTAKPSNIQGTYERNVIDPAFAFSDEETLPARKVWKNRRKSEPARLIAPQVLQTLQPKLQQPPSAKGLPGRNVVDPSYTFSDEENLLHRRGKTTRRQPEPAMSSKPRAEEDSSAGRDELDMMHDSPSKRKGRRQTMRSACKPVVAVDTSVDVAEGLVDQGAERTDPEPCPARPITMKRRPGRPRKVVERMASPELGDPSFSAVCPATEGVGKEKSETGSVATATSAPPQQPLTPKSKSKKANLNTPSPRTGLISLLSDNDDEEDEISFDLSAFTPSGHHRILTHRPYHPHTTTTTPRMSSNSTAGKKMRASSLFPGPLSTSKARKHRTPGSERKDGSGRRRGRANSLARSVVKVRRGSFRAPSPAGSVVQTPGGTKRRCGQDGFRCGRDFCFVCISI
ncbi:hypothetical protein VSDG_03951 [Cytospora chrysosperma]|uniref:Uncharacterized protein n=1 Tax=Cytospora chrysosperma TaxID=252740 RepID=A0A423W7E4_CYTCH|nr:hypothetical protein VSDG_03951 [Valsa sordida]